jgi:hypothetical protein
MMLAHGNPVLIVTFWGLLCVSWLTGGSACIGAFLNRRRQRWFLLCGLTSLLAGSWIVYVAAQDGVFDSPDWIAFVVVAPLYFGAVAVVRWSFLSI